MLRSGGGQGFTGQFVEEVDPESIAERAGLKVGDRVIEINGFNVETESHREVSLMTGLVNRRGEFVADVSTQTERRTNLGRSCPVMSARTSAIASTISTNDD
jgi:C-terminal processing protease CtpA/Prc